MTPSSFCRLLFFHLFFPGNNMKVLCYCVFQDFLKLGIERNILVAYLPSIAPSSLVFISISCKHYIMQEFSKLLKNHFWYNLVYFIYLLLAFQESLKESLNNFKNQMNNNILVAAIEQKHLPTEQLIVDMGWRKQGGNNAGRNSIRISELGLLSIATFYIYCTKKVYCIIN